MEHMVGREGRIEGRKMGTDNESCQLSVLGVVGLKIEVVVVISPSLSRLGPVMEKGSF